MSKADFAAARQRTTDYLREAGIEHHMLHGPASDDYWSAPLRVVAINMESYGYDECGHWEVDLACLLDWMYDRGDTGTKTVRYTVAMIKTLLDAHASETVPDREHLRSAYADAPGLEAVLRTIAYYNIRPTSNPQDTASIIASGSDPLAEFVRGELVALDPQVILIAGHAGLAAFNALWRLDPRLDYLGSVKQPSGLIIQSIKHPARPNYDTFAAAMATVVRRLNGV